jgi:transposase
MSHDAPQTRDARPVRGNGAGTALSWVIERTMAWLTGYRRPTPRYERHPGHFLAFLALAATITCYKKLTRCTT